MTEHATEPTPPPEQPATTTPQPATPGPGTDVVHHTDSLDARIRYSRQIAMAGTLLPKGVTAGVRPGDVDTIAARAFLIAETGGMLGIHPIAALQGVQVIEGRPTLAPALMQSLVRRAGHNFRIRTAGTVAGGDIAVTASITRSDDPEPFTATWDLERAERAGLCTLRVENGRTKVIATGSGGGAKPWQSYTEAMLKARATSEVCRDAAGDVLMGAHYTPEELGAIVDEDGVYVAQEDLATPSAPAGPPEETSQQVADKVAALIMAATDPAALRAVYEAGQVQLILGHSWTPDYLSPGDFDKRHTVTVQTASGAWTGTLFDLFAAAGAALQAAAEAPAPDEAPEPAPSVDGASQATAQDDGPMYPATADVSEPVDATTFATDEQGDDPWQGGGAMGTGPQTHDGAVHAVEQQLGGAVVDQERSGRAAEAQATHEAAIEQARKDRERERAQDQGRATPPAPGTARAAAIALAHQKTEKARAQRQAEEQGR